MRRIHTREGVHPYDEVTWERRDVVMTNWRDGSVNFEQHGVEFPDFWSVNAANIVTTKYFRGAVGTPQREWSLKQLVDRVVGTYTAAGREHGYFATEADAEIFSARAHLRAHPPDLQLQLPGLVQRRAPRRRSRSRRASPTTRWSAPRTARSRSASLVEDDAVGHQGARRARHDPDRRDQGQRRQGRAAAAHHRRAVAGRHRGPPGLARGRPGHRRVHRGRLPARRRPPAATWRPRSAARTAA